MKIIKNNKNVFVGVTIVAALIAIIPTTLMYMFSKMSIGIIRLISEWRQL